MEWYEEEVRSLERARVARAPDGQVVFYGSSSIRLWESLGEDVQEEGVLNLGFGGSTLVACNHFFKRLVEPCRPRSIVFYAGDNDLGDGRSPEEVSAALRSLLRKVRTSSGPIPFAFISIKPSPARWPIISRIKKANQLSRTIIDNDPTAHYIDIFGSMLDNRGLPRPELFEDDGLHLSRAGYQVWAEVIRHHRDKIF